MAYNNSPKVNEARKLAAAYNKKIVIIIMIDENTLEYASYGATASLCESGKQLADHLYLESINFIERS